jgi:hypothetical protein
MISVKELFSQVIADREMVGIICSSVQGSVDTFSCRALMIMPGSPSRRSYPLVRLEILMMFGSSRYDLQPRYVRAACRCKENYSSSSGPEFDRTSLSVCRMNVTGFLVFS